MGRWRPKRRSAGAGAGVAWPTLALTALLAATATADNDRAQWVGESGNCLSLDPSDAASAPSSSRQCGAATCPASPTRSVSGQQDGGRGGSSGSGSGTAEEWAAREASLPGDLEQLLLDAQTKAESGQTEEALAMLNKAVELYPSEAEVYRRRGILLSQHAPEKSYQDVERWLMLRPNDKGAREFRGWTAMATQRFAVALSDAEMLLSHNPRNTSYVNLLVRALTGLGFFRKAAGVCREALQHAPDAVQLWHDMGALLKELGDTQEAVHALTHAIRLNATASAYYRLCDGLYEAGYFRQAAEKAEEGLQLFPGTAALLHLKALSLHGQGMLDQAYVAYSELMLQKYSDKLDQDRVQEAFFQREIAAYTAEKLQLPLDSFSVDDEFDIAFREAWSRDTEWSKLKNVHQNIAPPSVSLDDNVARQSLSADGLHELLTVADRIGTMTQYDADSFPKNKRQYRMAGLAALDFAQRVRASWGVQAHSPRAASSTAAATTSSASGGSRSSSSGPKSRRRRWAGSKQTAGSGGGIADDAEGMEWRDAFAVLVKWRQIADPYRRIQWVDRLRNLLEVGGYSGITEILMGQKRNRYYPVHDKALKLLKDIISGVEEPVSNHTTVSADVLHGRMDEMMASKDIGELHAAIGGDFRITIPCHSPVIPGKVLVGSQLAARAGGGGHHFDIRTMGRLDRTTEYDKHLRISWKKLRHAITDTEGLRSTDPAGYWAAVHDAILRVTFLWYHLMPLTRGSAMVGYMGILGMALIADLEIRDPCPRNVQIDWEGMLSPRFSQFNASVAQWLFAHAAPLQPSVSSLPPVQSTLPTVAAVISALNDASATFQDDS